MPGRAPWKYVGRGKYVGETGWVWTGCWLQVPKLLLFCCGTSWRFRISVIENGVTGVRMASFMLLCSQLGHATTLRTEVITVYAQRPHAAGRNRNRIPPVDVNPKNGTWRPTGISLQYHYSAIRNQNWTLIADWSMSAYQLVAVDEKIKLIRHSYWLLASST